MAGQATSFVVDLETENDNSAEREKKSKNFIKVLRSKYCNDKEDFGFGYFGGKPSKKRTNSEGDAELGYLTTVCVSNSKIRTTGLQEQSIKQLCPNVVDLDISGNLLESWTEILPLVQQLHNLKFLNIAKNNITKNTSALYKYESPMPNVENLVLNKTGVRWKEVIQLAKLLPKLKELHLCGNNYKEIPEGKHHGLHSVECLRINDNHITSWDEVWKLRQLPNLKSLILSGNPLVDVYYKEDDLDCDFKRCCHSNDTDNAVDRADKHTEAPDKDKGTETVIDAKESEAVNSDRVKEEFKIPIDNEAPQNFLVDDTTVADSNGSVEALHDEVRQYCENILNSVIEDIIRDDVVQSNDAVTEDKENKASEKDDIEQTDQCIGKNEGLTNNIDDSTDKRLGTGDDEGIVSQGRENNQNNTEVEDPQGQIDADEDQTVEAVSENDTTEIKGDHEIKNGGKIGAEELIKEDNSCCPCDEKPSSLKPFTSLETLCISETKIGKWKHLSALRTFPSLKSVRIKNIKLGAKLNDEDRRKLFMASLPNVKLLNGSEVSQSEREKSERFLLRHFHEKKLKPDIYHTLAKRHGELTPLVDIDISKGLTEYVSVRFIYQGKLAFTENISVRSLADTLRNLIASKISQSVKQAVLYHKLCNSQHRESVGELQEMRSGSLPISRLEILDGDEIIIDDSKEIPYTRVGFYFKPK